MSEGRMNVAVLGAAGQLGAAIVREFEDAGARVMALTRQDVDVTTPVVLPLLLHLQPDVIVNCTAWNDVDGAEAEPDAAFAVNDAGVARLADAARRLGATLVHYSTDFVFDGSADEPYDEGATTAPLNRYGASKRAGEIAAAQVNSHYVMRLSSVFGGTPGEGAAGRVTIDRMVDALRAGREVRAFVDRVVTPSYTVDVARATRILVNRRAPAGVYHCVNSGATTWYVLACELAELLGTEAAIVPVPVSQVTMQAARPRFCALSNAKLAAAGVVMPAWQHALARHLRRVSRSPHVRRADIIHWQSRTARRTVSLSEDS